RYPQPHQAFHDGVVDKLGRAGVPQAFGDACPSLVDTRRNQCHEHHHGQANIERPEHGFEQLVVPVGTQGHATQAEQHQTNTQHTVDSEQGGVTMASRQVQALHVVQGDRRVDGKAQQARAYHVPETHGDKAENRPFVSLQPGSSFTALIVAIGLDTDQGQRHDFQGGEHGTNGDHRGRCAGEVQVVQGSQDTAEQEHDGLKYDGAIGSGRVDQAQAAEQQGNDRGGKDFKETFYPQVNQPPSPVFDHGVVSVLSPHQGRGVEQTDTDGGQEHHG